MNPTNRRRAIQLIMAATMAPSLVPRQAQAQHAGGLIAPPAFAMRFQRSVRRDLAGGAQMSVTRAFEVGFRHFADGFVVEGAQVHVAVDAPPSLAVFADLERERVESGLFPLTLDPFGQITSDGSGQSRDGLVELAFAEAQRRIASQPLRTGERADLLQFVAALHQTGALLTADLPRDLFAPDQRGYREDRTIPLPSGETGRVISRFAGERDATTHLMRTAMREVVTEMEGDRRTTLELWELTPA